MTAGAGRAVALAAAALALAGVQLGLMPLAALAVTRSIGEVYSDTIAGVWFTYYSAALMFGSTVGGIALGAAGDRWGRPRGLALSVALLLVGGGGGALVDGQLQLLVLRFLAGVGVGGVWPNAVALGYERCAPAARTRVAAVLGASMNAGIVALSLLGRAHPVTSESWRTVMLLAVAPALPIALVAAFMRSQRPRAESAAPLSTGALWRAPLARSTWAGVALAAIPLVGSWSASKWMIPWTEQVAGAANPGQKALTQICWAVGATVGSFSGAFITSRLGARRTYALISVGAVLTTCGLFVLLTPLHPAFLPAVLLQGLVSTMFFGLLPLCLPALFPAEVRGAGAGVAYNAGKLVSAAGVLAGASVVAVMGGDYGRIGAVTALVYLLGLLAARLLPRS